MLVSLKVYYKSRVGQALMYMQHRHMVCGESHICHELVLDKNVNGNSYSTPLIHEDLDVDHKMVMLGIGLYHNIFSHICVQHQNYPEHDIICPSILFYWLFFIFYLINTSLFTIIFRHMFLQFLARLTSLFCVKECIEYANQIFLIPIFVY